MKRFQKISIISLSVIILDQLTKWLIFAFAKESLLITKVRNTGAAFGILGDSSLLLGIIGIIAIGLMLYYSKSAEEKFIPYLALIIGGAAGNLIDRILIGYVRDFISISIWPVFNIADSAITIGALMIIFLTLKNKS